MDQIIALPIDANDPAYFMNKLALFTKPKSPAETQKMQKYLSLCKKECWARLKEILYNDKSGHLDCKHWLMMGKKPFMN